MEIAMDMKQRGLYRARQLNFQWITFKVVAVELEGDFEKMYDNAVVVGNLKETARLISADKSMTIVMWGQFWSSHQRFFKYLCIGAKVMRAGSVARVTVKFGKYMVIWLQSTDEARTLDQLEREDDELSDFVSSAKGVFQNLVEKHFPTLDRSKLSLLMNGEFKIKLKKRADAENFE